MLFNCTITSIQTPSGMTGSVVTYTTTTPVPAIRCQVAQPTRRQRIELGSLIADATMVIRVRESATKKLSLDLVEGQRMVLAPDGRPTRTAGVLKVIEPAKAGLRVWTAFLGEGN